MRHKLKYEDEHKRDRDICPGCGTSSGQENRDQFFIEGNALTQVVECDCGTVWVDTYKLESTDISRGTNAAYKNNSSRFGEDEIDNQTQAEMEKPELV